MEQKRIIKGNSTILPLGAEVIGENVTNAVTEASSKRKGNQPISDLISVNAARDWEMDNQL